MLQNLLYPVQLKEVHGQVDQQLSANDFVSVHVADKLDFGTQHHVFAVACQASDSSRYSGSATLGYESHGPCGIQPGNVANYSALT